MFLFDYDCASHSYHIGHRHRTRKYLLYKSDENTPSMGYMKVEE
jgi:hypothetical protein